MYERPQQWLTIEGLLEKGGGPASCLPKKILVIASKTLPSHGRGAIRKYPAKLRYGRTGYFDSFT
jgi:hypothetical protein